MATLTQCLTAALVPRYSGGAGAVPVHAAMARAVLSVLVGAAQGGACLVDTSDAADEWKGCDFGGPHTTEEKHTDPRAHRTQLN